MSSYTSTLPFGGLLIGHTAVSNNLTLQDGNAYYNRLNVEAQVKSGDYFIALASRLDEISEEISDPILRVRIESIVNDLLYMQYRYLITKQKD